jgi:hypothetical protein
MKRSCLQFAAVILIIAAGCRKPNDTSQQPQPPLPPPAPAPAVLLKDVIAHGLPSPLYHLEYNASGEATFLSYASDLRKYDIIYDNGRIVEMRNNITITLVSPNNDTIVTSINSDRLQYFYNNEGRVKTINIADSTGSPYGRFHFTYDGQKLIKFERERKSGLVFIIDRTMTMSYYADDNLMELSTHYPATPFNGQQEFNHVVRFEQYDDKINVDGFDILHPEFFDHVVLLPGIKLQKNNPRKQTKSGDGDDYTVDYTYTYSRDNAPMTKNGEFLYTSGVYTGRILHISTDFTYY